MLFKEEDRQYSPEDLKKTQDVLLEIMKDVLRVCKENDIPVSLSAGTAIGAVRHKGFIPWDDDIDLMLLREDYDRLLEILPEQLDEKFGVDDWLHNKDFPAPNACVYAKGTVAVPVEMKNCKYKYGISIGLYPYDNVWDDEKKADRQRKKCWLFGRLHWLKVLPFPFVPFYGLKKKIVHAICGFAHILLIPVKKEWLVKKCEQYSRECNHIDTKCVSIILDNMPKEETIEKEKLFPLIEVDFEGVKAPLINCYDEVLTKMYKFPYMELPPEEDRKNHFPCEMDFGNW